MKLWQKALAIALGGALTFSLAACGNTGGGNTGGGGSTGGGTTPPTATEQGTSLVTALTSQIENAKTITVKMNATNIVDETYWAEVITEEGTEADPTYTEKTYYNEEKVTLEATIAKTETAFNAKVVITTEEREEKNGEYETETSYAYLIDGFTYTSYDNVNFEKDVADMEEMETATSMITMLLDGVEITADEKTQLFASLGELVGETFTFTGTTATWNYDYKPAINDFVSYVNAIDETTTVEKVLNDALALVDEELTAEILVTKVSEFAGKTVNEAITAIDAWLTENYETTLQGIIDKVTDDPRVQTILTNYAEIEGASETEIAEMIAQVKAFDLAAMIAAQEGLGTTTLYDLIMMMVGSQAPVTEGEGEGEGSGMPTLAQMTAQINAMLDMPITQMVPEETFAMIGGVVANAANNSITLSFDSSYNVSKITLTQNTDVTVTSVVTQDKSNVANNVSTAVIELALSATATTIAIPENATVTDNTVEAE